MRSLESKSAPAQLPVRRRLRDGNGEEAVTSRAEDPAPDDDTGNSEAAPAADEASLPEAPSLSAAGVGLGIVGLIGTVAVGAGAKAQMEPLPKPLPPIKPVQPVAPVTPVEPDKPTTPVTPIEPVEPTTPVTPIKPVEPTTPVTPVKPVEPVKPIAPEKPIEPVLPGPASFSLSNAHVIEDTSGTRELVFLVQRSGDLNQTGSVRFSVQADKSTVAADDLVGVQTGTASFKAGEAQQLVRLQVNGDYLRETDEQVWVKLSDPIGGTLDRAEGIGTIHEVDVTRLQAAYGMRDLNAELEGFAIRVRRSSDDTVMDIGFDADGQLDREALLNFVGREATDKGYVTRWYDQSGNARHMESKELARQGVIVDGGQLVKRSDGSSAISFNAGRNGEQDDRMIASGLAAEDWRSAAIYANVQSEGTRPGGLFLLSGSGESVSADYPSGDGSIAATVRHFQLGSANLFSAVKPTIGHPDGLVFEAHTDNRSDGTASLNYTDANQAIYQNGRHIASGSSVQWSFRTDGEWKLAMRWDSNSPDGAQAMYNEFLVYLDKDNSTPSLQNLTGSAQDDVLTYSGERDLKRVDGLAGWDTIHVSGKSTLDLTQFKDGIKHVEQFWLRNGEADTLKLTAQALSALDVDAVTFRLDTEDRVEIDQVAVPLDSLAARLNQLSPTMQFHVIVGNEAVI